MRQHPPGYPRHNQPDSKGQRPSQTPRKITRRQALEKRLLEIINSNQAYQSAEIARFERWAKEFHRKPPVVEVPAVDRDGLPTGETVELPTYVVKAVERFCEKRGLDPGKFVNEILKTLLPLLLKSEEAREAFFRGRTGELAAWFGRHRHR